MGIDLGNWGGLVVLSDEPAAGGPAALEAIALKPSLTSAGFQSLVYELAKKHQVELIATERPGMWGRISVGMAQREKQGLVRAVCQALQLPPVMEFQPQEIKRAITGHGRADKLRMMRAVNALVRLPGNQGNEHVCDAAAIALLAMNRKRQKRQWKTRRSILRSSSSATAKDEKEKQADALAGV